MRFDTVQNATDENYVPEFSMVIRPDVPLLRAVRMANKARSENGFDKLQVSMVGTLLDQTGSWSNPAGLSWPGWRLSIMSPPARCRSATPGSITGRSREPEVAPVQGPE